MIAKKISYKRFVSSLALANYGTGLLDVVGSLLLLDIAVTFFGSSNMGSIGVASQIAALSGIAAVIFGFLSSILSVRIRPKPLLLFGSLLIVIGAIGCYFAPNFLFMEIFYPLDGAGTVIVGSMAITLIGENISVNKRPKAISWVLVGAILSSALGYPIAGFIAGIGGWRYVVLFYTIPVSILALVLAFSNIPQETKSVAVIPIKGQFAKTFKQVVWSKSVIACLMGNFLMTAGTAWVFFASTFWRQQFSISVQSTSIINFVIIVVYALGSLIGGKFIHKIGRKRVVVYAWAIRALLIALIPAMPTFSGAFIMTFAATLIGGFALSSGPSLSLEQVPLSRGTMMSLHNTFISLGSTIGLSIGGIVLSQLGYQSLAIAFACFGVAATFVILFFAKDPCNVN